MTWIWARPLACYVCSGTSNIPVAQISRRAYNYHGSIHTGRTVRQNSTTQPSPAPPVDDKVEVANVLGDGPGPIFTPKPTKKLLTGVQLLRRVNALSEGICDISSDIRHLKNDIAKDVYQERRMRSLFEPLMDSLSFSLQKLTAISKQIQESRTDIPETSLWRDINFGPYPWHSEHLERVSQLSQMICHIPAFCIIFPRIPPDPAVNGYLGLTFASHSDAKLFQVLWNHHKYLIPNASQVVPVLTGKRKLKQWVKSPSRHLTKDAKESDVTAESPPLEKQAWAYDEVQDLGNIRERLGKDEEGTQPESEVVASEEGTQPESEARASAVPPSNP